MYIEVRFQAPSLLHLPALHQTGHCFGAGSLFIWPESVFSCPLPLLYHLSARQRLSPGGPLCQHLLTLPVMTLCQYLRFWDFCYLPQWSIPSGLLTQNLSFAFAPTRWQQCPTECPSSALPSPSKGYLFFESVLFLSWKIQAHSPFLPPPTHVDFPKSLLDYFVPPLGR